MMIKFGTDGWRAIIGDGFTFENVRIVTQAIADYINNKGNGHKGVVVGYDTRFLSPEFAKAVAEVLAGNNIRVFLSDKVAPTPVISFAVKKLNTAGGIMVTASHNPAAYNGIKFKADFGGSALPDMTREIETFLYCNPVSVVPINQGLADEKIRYFDPNPPYLEHIRNLIDLDKIAASGIKVVIDPMYGAGRGYLAGILSQLGLDVLEIHGEDNPGFGGLNPEPIDKNLQELVAAVKEWGGDIGLATDGDADRVGAIDHLGEFVNSHQIYALFFRHLVETRNWSGGVVKTFSTTTMIDKLADRLGIPVFETPIGFKYICELFLNEDILLGGEESGGIGFKNHIPERDGILSSLLLLEIMAYHQKPLRKIIDGLMQDIGYHYYDRLDLHLEPGEKEVVLTKLAELPEQVAGLKVARILKTDGTKLLLEDGSWLLLRPSGTEPVLRIYAEADSREKVKQLLTFGKNLVT